MTSANKLSWACLVGFLAMEFMYMVGLYFSRFIYFIELKSLPKYNDFGPVHYVTFSA